MSNESINVHWFRRDLRIHDNTSLHFSLKSGTTLPVFIFDKNILDKLDVKDDRRVDFIHTQLQKLKEQLQSHDSDLKVFYGKPADVWKKILDEYDIGSVYTNEDYEPYATERDNEVADLLESSDVKFHQYKDQVIFAKDDVLKDDGDPYVVFTPYSKKWKEKYKEEKPGIHSNKDLLKNLYKTEAEDLIELSEMGFEDSDKNFPSAEFDGETIEEYKDKRNFPAKKGTSRLSVHLRFGTISVRELAEFAKEKSETFLNELIWREFYQMILYHFPYVVDREFRKKYEGIPWRNDEDEFDKWCKGKTGYPLVDAGMRQLNKTGYMHNRVRMVVASFLTKHLLIDWRWGEAYFAEKLLDYELASNNGGWQWAAGCGTDAAPYFRVFNPYSQEDKFDKDGKYIKQWVEEIDTDEYPDPVVDHKEARERALSTYKEALSKATA